MTIETILAELDAEIARLKQVRDLLSTTSSSVRVQPVRKRRTLSAAARKKIAEAQKARWAKQKAGK